MHVWTRSLRRTKNAIISWHGSNRPLDLCSLLCDRAWSLKGWIVILHASFLGVKCRWWYEISMKTITFPDLSLSLSFLGKSEIFKLLVAVYYEVPVSLIFCIAGWRSIHQYITRDRDYSCVPSMCWTTYCRRRRLLLSRISIEFVSGEKG